MLLHLRRFGFVNLTGVDPFLAADVSQDGVSLFRASITDLDADYQAIIANHSVEHVDDPCDLLTAARERLKKNGHVVVRLPLVGGRAWQRYRDNMVSLDSPLHRFIPTMEGAACLAARSGYEVMRRYAEAAPWVYTASEAIRFSAPPSAPGAVGEDFRRWASRVARNDRRAMCPQATFVLRPVG